MKQIKVEIAVFLIYSAVCLEALPRKREAFSDRTRAMQSDIRILPSEEEAQRTRISGQTGFSAILILNKGSGETKLGSSDVYDTQGGNQKTNVYELTNNDILPPKSKQRKQGTTDPFWLWPNKTIPLLYSSSLSLKAIAAIEEARVEFELQTCVCFEDWTSEVDHVEIGTSSGCSSYVGRQGGKQTLSMADGCGHLAVAQHEIMHAMGIYHEQSRPDRDEHVIIKTENIEADRIDNFDKEDYYLVNKTLATYDYDSVMHYSAKAFSKNDLPTIVTLNTAYQEVIGQRRDFSEGDVTEMKSLYSCGKSRRYSHYCHFEDQSDCGYTIEVTNLKSNWKRTEAISTGEVGRFSNTDGTYGTTEKGSYMALNNEPGESDITASLTTVEMVSKVPRQCLHFRYKISQNSILRVLLVNVNRATGEELLPGTEVTSLSGNGAEYWNLERVTINASSDYKIVFEGKVADATVSTTTPALAIDDVNILDKSCESNYFVINNYAHILSTSQKNDNFLSNLFVTEDGYSFKVLVYPQGGSSATDGYMSVYFCLARGNDDDNLEWPFNNRVIKISVVDQQSNVLHQMNQNQMILTTSETNLWGRPTSELNSCFGSRNFLNLSSLTGSRQFLKHDTIMISVDVTDMSAWTHSQNKYNRPSTSFKINCEEYDSHPSTSSSSTSTAPSTAPLTSSTSTSTDPSTAVPTSSNLTSTAQSISSTSTSTDPSTAAPTSSNSTSTAQSTSSTSTSTTPSTAPPSTRSTTVSTSTSSSSGSLHYFGALLRACVVLVICNWIG